MAVDPHARGGVPRASLGKYDWTYAPATPGGAPHDGDWLPAIVPGDVRLSLLAAGRIPDPLIGRNAERLGWVADHDWWFRCHIGEGPGRRFVVFDGLDYLAEVFFAGRFLGRHEGMFSRQRYELPATAGDLTVRLGAPSSLRKPALSPTDRLLQAALRRAIGGEYFPDRLGTLKMQMAYGWDFAPALPTVGIWDDAWLVTTGPVAITDLTVTSRQTGADATVFLDLDLDSLDAAAAQARADVTLLGADAPAATTEAAWDLPGGSTRRRLRVHLSNARRWQPWERGASARYLVRVQVFAGDELSDHVDEMFGIRTVEVVAPGGGGRGAPATDCVGLVVNGEPLFLRGANWVPADALLGKLRPEDYRALLTMAKDAGINILRVWGGGLRERRAFYNLCDELGLLVWQEFPFACAFFDHFPTQPDYLDLVEREAGGIVRALRNHPSVAFWCGGNEFSANRNPELVSRLALAVAREDGARPFRAASPGPGEQHNWRVWHGYANLADYRLVTAPLLSEFGLQAAPAPATLRTFLPDGIAPGPDWEFHNAQLDKLRRYASTDTDDPEAFALATQRAQAHGLQIAIEHMRRRKGRSTGVLFWQFNEPWGAICWSVVDYERRPKLAFDLLKLIYQPMLVSLEYPLRRFGPGDHLTGTFWLVNDLLSPLDGLTLEVRWGGKVIASRSAAAPPNAAANLGPLDVVLPEGKGLELVLRRGDDVLATNRYDLDWQDDEPTSTVHALRDWVTWAVVSH